MTEVKIFEIRKPDPKAVRNGTVGQELIVYFTVNGKKFKCKYVQEHYFYRGMPGVWHENLSFFRLEDGEANLVADCSGEFKIPHDKKFNENAYAHSNYDGDDPRYLNADEKIVRQYLIDPFVERYF